MLTHKYGIMFHYYSNAYMFCTLIAIDNVNRVCEISLLCLHHVCSLFNTIMYYVITHEQSQQVRNIQCTGSTVNHHRCSTRYVTIDSVIVTCTHNMGGGVCV